MHDDRRVSIMIPAHKPALFQSTLRSALAQHSPGLEIIISDDSGGDEIEKIVQSVQPDPRVSYSKNPNPTGITGNYHRLLQLARGKWGLFLDDDDLLYPNAISALLRAMTSNPGTVLVYAGYDLVDFQTDERRSICVGRITSVRRGTEFFKQFCDLPPVTATVLFDLDAARAAGIFNHSQNVKSGDWEAWLKIALHGDVAYVPAITACRRVNDQSFSAIPNLAMDVDNAIFIDRAGEYAIGRSSFSAPEIDRWRRNVLAWYYTWIFAGHIPRRRYADLWQGALAVWRRHPLVAVRVFANMAIWGSLVLSPFPDLHRTSKQLYRRVRFGPVRAANF